MNRRDRRALAKTKDPRELAQRAEVHVKEGRLDQAEKANREALALDPRCHVAHNNLGNILRHTGRVAEAVRHFSLALQISPHEPVVAQNLATALTQLNRFSEAVPVHRQAVALNPSSADARTALAFSLTQISEFGEAELHYAEALRIDPLHFVARINWGLALVDQGKVAEAFEQAGVLARAENAPGFPHKAFGILLARAGCPDGAKICFERHLAGHPGEADAVAMLLAAVGGALPPRATDRQIAQLYTLQADRWDHQVATAAGGYQGHRLVAEAFRHLNAGGVDTILDAGCGTGLVGELLRPQARRLIGVDMSEAMLAQARQKNIHDSLHRGDLVQYLVDHPKSCDAVVSAATLIHFGALDAVFAGVASCLRPGGLFVFTVFPNDDDPAAVAIGTLNGLAQNGCFRHGADYIRQTAAAHGLTVELLRREVHEYARKAAIDGLVVALRLGQAPDGIVRLAPDQPDPWWQLGQALSAEGRHDEALRCYEHVIRLDPAHRGALVQAGHLLERAGRLDEALLRLDRGAELQPDHVETLHARALVLSRLGRREEALADNMRAIARDPDNFAICCNIGNTLRALGRQDDALAWYDRALSLSPNVTSATNKALSLAELGRIDEAMAAYRHALSLDPEQPETIWNFALLQLMTGDFEPGWRGREARWRIPGLGVGYPDISTPMWLGEQPIAGKTILVCQDEGLGDAIQFARYIPMLAAQGARVILVVAEPLCPLLAGLDGVAQCLPKTPDMVLPPFDLHVAIDSLPLAFGTRLHDIPAPASYLSRPEPDRLRAWQHRLEPSVGQHRKLRVGLVWSGNPSFRNDRNRSVPLALLSPILDVDATFVSLQKDLRPEDGEVLRERKDIIDHTAHLTDFAETAALVASLDLVITVDTSVAHLAAAMGRPTWILLPHVADWRWLRERDDSPWYPTVRLFRQSAIGDYAGVVDRVRAELSALVAQRRDGA